MGLINEVNNINATLNRKEREKQEKQKAKEFYKTLLEKCDNFLFEKINDKIKKENNLYIVYLDNEKHKIIDLVFIEISKRYDLKENTQEKINYYLDSVYYKIANKVITIYKKKEKALEIIEQQKQVQLQTQKLTFEEKAMYLEIFLNFFFFGFPILLILYLVIKLFSI